MRGGVRDGGAVPPYRRGGGTVHGVLFSPARRLVWFSPALVLGPVVP